MDHLKLLCEIGELNWISSDSTSIKTFLQKIVIMVAGHMQADVCSIYLYDEGQEQLILKATKGLHPDSVGKVKLKLGEGLVGLAVKELRPICEPVASVNPHFKFFPGIFEERYESFLVVPILRGTSRIGALTVQREKENYFKDQDVMALRAVASQLANIIENARLLLSFHEHNHEKFGIQHLTDLKSIKGKVASEGIALGEVTIVEKGKMLGRLFQMDVDRPYDMVDFKKAVNLTENQLRKIQVQVADKVSDDASLIFASHLLMVKDTKFVGAMTESIESGENPPTAILKVAKQYLDIFSQSSSPYIREKVQDIKDLALRLVGNLVSDDKEQGIWKNRIVIAQDLFPSDLLKMSSEGVSGIILVGGGVASHLAILARSLRIPLLIVDVPELLSLPEKATVLLDAELGSVYINPEPTLVANFQASNLALSRTEKTKQCMKPVTLTRDGTRVRLLSNINLLADLQVARDLLSEGVGLYRTELPFMIRSAFPSEEEQLLVYRKLVEGMPGKPITFRTLDLGGDKVLAYYHSALERNPFLGMRSIRFCLQNRDVFVQQIRAMLRAGLEADLQIMFPMISSLDEFREARQIVSECRDALERENLPHNARPRVGMMVEIPSVVDLIDDFAQEVDFFSIGTNDLIQYTLAVDRTNEKVANFYIPHHPSILRSIKRVVAAARRYEVEVSICGDMAHDERYVLFFLGIGVRILSVDPIYLPKIQRAIAEMTLREAEETAERILRQNTVKAIDRILAERAPQEEMDTCAIEGTPAS
jgi:phosphotransferase system enzyme I (PtsP)